MRQLAIIIVAFFAFQTTAAAHGTTEGAGDVQPRQVAASGTAKTKSAARRKAARKVNEMAELLCSTGAKVGRPEVVYHKLGGVWMASVTSDYSCKVDGSASIEHATAVASDRNKNGK